ncbi:Zonadhesin [Trichinella spiralis]|uniref:Zonadhesin n=1 Tax=Trichinella spiralis TaxID=6334 RepID=A0ABR3KZP3_TRISP
MNRKKRILHHETALASEVTAINVDQLDIVPSIPEETDKKPEITDVPKAEKKDSKKIKKKSKKRTKSKKTKETEKDIAAKEAASSQIPETDITSPNLALASEVTAINVDQLDIAPSIPEETDEKPVITIYRKKTKKTEKDTAAKEGATSQVTETDITSPKFTLASEDTAVDVDQQNIVPTIPEETVEKPLLKDEPKGEKKDSKKIKKKSKKRTKSKKTKKTEKDIALKKQRLLKDRNGYYITETGAGYDNGEPKGEKKDSKKIKKKSKKRTKSKKTKETEKDIAAKEAASSQIPETDITSPNLALASEVTAINVDQLDIVPSIPEETDKKPEITDVPIAEKKDSKKIRKKSQKRTKSKKTKKTEKDKPLKKQRLLK